MLTENWPPEETRVFSGWLDFHTLFCVFQSFLSREEKMPLHPDSEEIWNEDISNIDRSEAVGRSSSSYLNSYSVGPLASERHHRVF